MAGNRTSAATNAPRIVPGLITWEVDNAGNFSPVRASPVGRIVVDGIDAVRLGASRSASASGANLSLSRGGKTQPSVRPVQNKRGCNHNEKTKGERMNGSISKYKTPAGKLRYRAFHKSTGLTGKRSRRSIFRNPQRGSRVAGDAVGAINNWQHNRLGFAC